VVKQAAFAEAGAAIITTEFVAVSNVIPAFTAFYGSIHELKHQTLRYSQAAIQKGKKGLCAFQQLRLSTVSLIPAMKKAAL
jgi:hypothetical protein